ncbi:Hypothetical protein CINCED_3A001243 [Cinara cedri]|uniref:Uncharacterized protein n=1 Tax=Cinara cedri TaxID=506608 RepID=A0A5E4N4Z6_9HEMI|nr:Hypothetical protein CINCED_3A001243 [Cinara cedri]
MEFNSATGKDDQSGSEVQQNFGRHEAHKHHDTMGEIVQGGASDFTKFKYNHVSDFVDNRFKEMKHSENDGTYQGDTDGRHGAHKHHDTMGEILKNDDDTKKYNHDSDFVDKLANKSNNSEDGDAHQDGRHGAHKHHDTMGEIVGGDGKVPKSN